jgi:hypothetical protein
MFEVPHSAPSAKPRRLALLWMGVGLMNVVMYWQLVGLLFQLLADTALSFTMQIHLIRMTIGVSTLTLQWLVLRRFFPGMGQWVALHGGVLFAQALLGTPVYSLLERLMDVTQAWSTREMLISLLDLLFWAIILGVAGWIIFRAVVQRARLWLWVTLLGALIQWFIFLLIRPLDIEYSRIDIIYYLADYGGPLLTAAIQAAVLVAFLRERERPAVAAAA